MLVEGSWSVQIITDPAPKLKAPDPEHWCSNSRALESAPYLFIFCGFLCFDSGLSKQVYVNHDPKNIVLSYLKNNLSLNRFCTTGNQCCGSGMFIPDPGCLSRILIFTHPGSRIPDPGSRIPDPGSRIPDLGSKNSNKRERWKMFFGHAFLCSHKFHKIVNYFIF